MENIIFDLLKMHRHGSAFEQYLALRKKFFVDTLKWGIPHDAQVEMDQYDNPLAHYSIVLRDGEVIAGARAIPTTARWGDHSYMLRDACNGKLSAIPSGLIPEAVVSDKVWECTRLVVADSVTSMRDRIAVLGLIVDGLIDIAQPRGGETLMSLSNLWLHRALRKLGHDCDLWCEPYVNADDGHKYAVMAMPISRVPEFVPQPTHRPQPGMVHAPSHV